MSSRNIMMGYLFNEEKTKEAIDEEGWMHSGDLGTELENGYFKVKFNKRFKLTTTLLKLQNQQKPSKDNRKIDLMTPQNNYLLEVLHVLAFL